jgi:hypothetical protein
VFGFVLACPGLSDEITASQRLGTFRNWHVKLAADRDVAIRHLLPFENWEHVVFMNEVGRPLCYQKNDMTRLNGELGHSKDHDVTASTALEVPVRIRDKIEDALIIIWLSGPGQICRSVQEIFAKFLLECFCVLSQNNHSSPLI